MSAAAPPGATGRLRALLWDLDGTLIDSEPLHAQALAAPFADEGLVLTPALHEQVLGLSAHEIHAHYRRTAGLRMGYDDWIARRWAAYLAQVHTLHPREGAIEAFDRVAAHGAPQAVVSNGDRVVVQANLAAIGLAGRVAFALGREDVGHPKPHPEPYRLAAQRLGLTPADCVVVEDSVNGARAGVAAGCRTFYWPQGGSPAEAPEGAQAVDSAEALLAQLDEAFGPGGGGPQSRDELP